MMAKDASLAALLENRNLAAVAEKGSDWLLDECDRLAKLHAPSAVSVSVRLIHKRIGCDHMVSVDVTSHGYGASNDKTIANAMVTLNSHEGARRVALAVASIMLRDKAKTNGIKIPRRR
jgi:hypothetical protein